MTARLPNALKALFETGDIPTSADFGDIFDSYINVSETSSQTIAGSLILTNPNAYIEVPIVTASVVVTKNITADTMTAQSIVVDGEFKLSVDSSINAAGSTLGSAYPLTATYNVVVVASAGVNAGVLLTQSNKRQIVVWNRSATAANVYPSSALAQIDSLAAGSPFVVTAGESYSFTRISSSLFLSGK